MINKTIDMIDNVYENLMATYINFIDILNSYDRISEVIPYSLFSEFLTHRRINKDTNKLIKSLEKYHDHLEYLYNEASDLWNTGNSLQTWLNRIESFSKFIRIAEKCFMYRNDPKSKVCSEFNSEKNTESIIITSEKQYKIIITFQYNSSDLKESIIIRLKRDFGKNLCNEFKFKYGSSPIYNDYEDEVLMESIRSIVSSNLQKTFEIIFDLISQYNQRGYKLSLTEVLRNEYYYIQPRK